SLMNPPLCRKGWPAPPDSPRRHLRKIRLSRFRRLLKCCTAKVAPTTPRQEKARQIHVHTCLKHFVSNMTPRRSSNSRRARRTSGYDCNSEEEGLKILEPFR